MEVIKMISFWWSAPNSRKFWVYSAITSPSWEKSNHPIRSTYDTFSISIKVSTLGINFNWIACDVEFNKRLPTVTCIHRALILCVQHAPCTLPFPSLLFASIGSVECLSFCIDAFLLRWAALSPSLCTFALHLQIRRSEWIHLIFPTHSTASVNLPWMCVWVCVGLHISFFHVTFLDGTIANSVCVCLCVCSAYTSTYAQKYV